MPLQNNESVWAARKAPNSLKVQETTLANGLRVVTAQMRDARSVAVNVAVATGSRLEDYNFNGGVSHFLEHLLFKGTLKYPTAIEISEAVDEVGGYNNAYTTEDITNYFIKVPARHTDLALDILTDMVKEPLLDTAEIDRERGVVIEEMHMWQDDPQRFISTLYPDLLFPNNSLGKNTFGPEEVIRSIKPETIRAYLAEHYRPNNLVVAVAGRLEHEIIVAQVEALLGDLEPGDLPGVQTVGRNSSDKIFEVFQKDTAQTHFVIAMRGYAYHHVDNPAMRVIAAILGAGSSSRLFVEVREKRGLAYTISADMASYVDTGVFEVYAGATIEKADEALEATLAELERLRHELVGERELKKAKEQLRSGLELSQESNSAVADRISRQLALEGRLTSIDDAISEVLSVTAEDVMRVAHDMFAPEQLRLAVIAPDPQPVADLFLNIVQKETV
jgi:predicted Zn-dependent peptidase